MNIKYRDIAKSIIAFALCFLMSGCSAHKNPLLTPDGLSGVRAYFEVMGDDQTVSCINYFADNSKSLKVNSVFVKGCNEQFTSAYTFLRKYHPEFMQNVKTSDFFDPMFWQTYLGINK